MIDPKLSLPKITDEDIDWVCSAMGLDAVDEPRRDFLQRCSTVDLSACPGSGKTTLVVAKLAMLARKWPYRTRGICVLSHTNVAREQIERRLGQTVVGQKLLAYPHFIDTIHGFVNRFLGLPWLYSNGYPSPTIDDEVTTAYRRGVMGNRNYRSVQNFLTKKYSSFDRVRICGRDLSFDLGGKPFPAGPASQSFQHTKMATEAAAKAGYFCYDEMFIWANALIEDHSDLPDWFAERFPLIILDEMQDTSTRQGCFLNSIFPRDSGQIVVQRVGDPNQAIFDVPDAGSSSPDPYPDPDPARCLSIPNSYRFGREIAQFASAFAVHPVGRDGLTGIGPRRPGAAIDGCKHAIFVFPDDNTDGVLDAFGAHALDVLGDALVAGSRVHAVGHIHQDDPNIAAGHPHYPKSVGHYWRGYAVEVARKDPHPRTLAQYIRAAQGLVSDSGTLSPGVEKIVSGTLELARRLGDIGDLKRKTKTHRAVVDALEGNTASLQAYRDFVQRFLVEKIDISKAEWPSHADDLMVVASALCKGETETREAKRFLAWPNDDAAMGATEATSSRDAVPNKYGFQNSSGCVDIQMGSIHSVKGQTHLATLLLNTYWHDHSTRRMMPWLLGHKTNGTKAGKQDLQRLLHTYVAMTRPTHLLCLAVPQLALGGDQDFDINIEILKERGWQVAEIIAGSAQWRV